MSDLPEKSSNDIQQEWYTICGKKHSDYQSFVRIIATLASIAIPTYSYAYILWWEENLSIIFDTCEYLFEMQIFS